MSSDDSTQPYERIRDVRDVRNDVSEMQDNLEQLQDILRELEWGRLGGMAIFDRAEAHKLCVVTAENLEHIAEEIDDLPTEADTDA